MNSIDYEAAEGQGFCLRDIERKEPGGTLTGEAKTNLRQVMILREGFSFSPAY